MSRKRRKPHQQLEIPLLHPPIKPGSKVLVNGQEMIVYYLDSAFTHIFLLPGGKVARAYPKEEVEPYVEE